MGFRALPSIFAGNMKEILIRKALPGEEKEIHEAHMRSIREVCVRDHGVEEIKGWGNRPLENRWVDAIKTELVWVIEFNKTIQGLGYLRVLGKDEEKIGYLHALYLTPEVLGKGVGLKLAKVIITEAKEQQLGVLKLDSTITAYEFYKSLGFKDAGPKKKVEIGGYPVTCFPMKYKII